MEGSLQVDFIVLHPIITYTIRHELYICYNENSYLKSPDPRYFPPMDLKQLEYFRHVAELGSFTRAASFLSVVQPALSRQVRQLEVELHPRRRD